MSELNTQPYWNTRTYHDTTPAEDIEFEQRLAARKLEEQEYLLTGTRAEAIQRQMDFEAQGAYYGQCIRDLADAEEDLAFEHEIVATQQERIRDLSTKRNELLSANAKQRTTIMGLTGKLLTKSMELAMEKNRRAFYGVNRLEQ